MTKKGRTNMSKAKKTIDQVRSQRPRKNGPPYLFSTQERVAFTTPVVLCEKILAEVDQLEKPWEKQERLEKAIKKACYRLKKCNVRTTAGLFKAQQWALAIDVLRDKLNEMDQQRSMMEKATTFTVKLLKGGNSKEIYHRKGVVGHRKDGTEMIGKLRNVKPYVVQGVKSFPVKDNHGNITGWNPGLTIDARMEPRMLAVQGSRWTYDHLILHPNGTKTVVNPHLVRFATHASPSVRQLGEAEMGMENEFVPLQEPDYGQVEIRRDASSNHIELADDGARAFNVVDEENINRRYTYSPEREQAWLDAMLSAVESAKTPRELMWVMDEFITVAWKAKAIRFNVYEQAHNACVLKGREKCPNHKVISTWKTIGDADMQLPEVTPEFEKWALLHPTAKKVKALQAHWDNLLRREGLGAGFDGQPFSDTSEDALEQKEARAGDGSIESLDRMFSGDDDSDEDEAPTKGGPVHTQAVDSMLTLEDVQREKLNPSEAFAMACALFGRTRGGSVDLIHKPRVSDEPWKSIPRPRMQSHENPEELINAAVRADMSKMGFKVYSVDELHPDSTPDVGGFESFQKLLSAFVRANF